MNDIDLPPSQYKSDRLKPREPIFGAGALPLFGGLIGTALALCMLIAIAWLGWHAKLMVWGEPPDSKHYTWTPDHGLVPQPSKEDLEAEMKRRGLR